MLSHGSLRPYELVPVCLSCLLWATSLHSLYFRPLASISPPMATVCPGPLPSLSLSLVLEHPQPTVFSFMETVLSSYQFSQLLRVHSFMSLYPTLLHVYFVFHRIANDILFLLN